MGKACCVEGCRSNESHKLCGISFHRIPNEENLRAKWLKAIGRDNREMKTKYPKVCSKHFKPTDFKPTRQSKLKEDAVPFKEEHEIILINQDKIKLVSHDDIVLVCSDSSNSFDNMNTSEISLEQFDEQPSIKARVLQQDVQFFEKSIQTTAYIGPREEALQKRVRALRKKLNTRDAIINFLEKQLKESLEREERLKQIVTSNKYVSYELSE